MAIKLIKRLGLQSRQGINMGRKEDKRRGFVPDGTKYSMQLSRYTQFYPWNRNGSILKMHYMI
jgi:hypothetical protein